MLYPAKQVVRPSEFGRSGQISRLNLPSAKETPLHEPVDSCPQPSPRVEGTCLALAGTPSEFAAENPRPGVARSSLLRQNHFGGRAQPWAECCNPIGIERALNTYCARKGGYVVGTVLYTGHSYGVVGPHRTESRKHQAKHPPWIEVGVRTSSNWI